MNALDPGAPPTDREDLFAVRRWGPLPDWGVGTLAVLGFLGTVGATFWEYEHRGTTFGLAGPAFNTLFAPVYEELIFRGWMLGRLERRFGPRRAIVLSSLLFGLVHVRNVYWREVDAVLGNVLYTGVLLGPLLAWVTLRTRSLWPAVVLHYANNLTYFLRL